MSHELRTPLSSIRGSLQLIDGGVAGDISDKASDLVTLALRNCDRLLHLISEALDLDNLDNGAMKLSCERLDPIQLAEQSAENIAGFAKSEGITVRVDAPNPVSPINGDHERLLRVMDNLLSNAIKYSPVDKPVTLSVSDHHGSVRFEVTDHGPGVPDAFRIHLFRRFSSSPIPRRSKQPSSGLGLALAKQIVALHDGDIAFAPNLPTGSRFIVRIPALRDASPS